MGAKFSTLYDDAQFLVRDKNGRLIIYQGKTDVGPVCTPLPIPMDARPLGPGEQKLQYMFFPSKAQEGKGNGKDQHLHTFFDSDCETPGNDVVSPEKDVLKKKNINHIKQSDISNSSYFEFNNDPINMPLHPSFIRIEDGKPMPRKTKRSGFNQCTLIPYQSVKESKTNARLNVDVDHNTVPLRLYTDDKCENEYVNTLPDPKQYKLKHNVDDRNMAIQDNSLTMKYTNINSYVEPSIKSNAKYYRTYRDNYPNNIS